MSFGLYRQLLSCLGISALAWLGLPATSWAQPGCTPCASFGIPCGVGPSKHHCPPAFKYTVEGPPRIHWGHGCPHPICNPCDLPHWGFYETCWNPWPFPPTWAHCPSPPPAAFVHLNPYGNTTMPPVRNFQVPGVNPGNPEEIQLPPPRTTPRSGLNP